MAQITTLPKSKASLIRKLVRDKKARDTEGLFVLEGEKPIRELLRDASAQIQTIVMTSQFVQKAGQHFLKEVTSHPARPYLSPEILLSRLSDVQTSQGILAVVSKPHWEEAAIFGRPQLLGLYGERLQDPANVGSIIRTGLALGVDAMWFSPDSADPFNPKVTRGTAGTLLKLPIFTTADAASFIRQRCVVLATEPTAQKSQDLRTIAAIPTRTVVAVGNESLGLSAATLKLAAVRFHIATTNQVESLNVAAATAISLFHLSGLPRTPITRELEP
jgi:RNA methyltransferase, TrmH family